MSVHRCWAPPLPYRTFCGLDREGIEKVEEVLTGRRLSQTEKNAAWRERAAFSDTLKRREVSTGTMEVS